MISHISTGFLLCLGTLLYFRTQNLSTSENFSHLKYSFDFKNAFVKLAPVNLDKPSQSAWGLAFATSQNHWEKKSLLKYTW